MRILYGVCGEGFGHSSRAKTVIEHLKKRGHEILILTYGQAYPVLKHLSKTIEVKGIHLYFDENGLKLSKTFSKSLKNILGNLKNLNQIKEEINSFNPELCITDMEPFVPIIRNLKKLPLISIDNQHRITHLSLKVPKKYRKPYFLAKNSVNSCVSRANAFIILSFTKQKSPIKNTFLVSPILRPQIIESKSRKGNYVLVYQTKKDDKLIKMLEGIDENFVVYGYDKKQKNKNIVYKKAGLGFIKDLASCKAIIASSGFSLMSEALFLKKPYFAIPLKGQFEQTLNSLFLRKAGFGEFSENPSLKEIKYFLDNLGNYEKKLKNYKTNPDDAILALDKIINELKSN